MGSPGIREAAQQAPGRHPLKLLKLPQPLPLPLYLPLQEGEVGGALPLLLQLQLLPLSEGSGAVDPEPCSETSEGDWLVLSLESSHMSPRSKAVPPSLPPPSFPRSPSRLPPPPSSPGHPARG